MWPVKLERLSWRTCTGLPPALEQRRTQLLKKRTGPQLKQMIQRLVAKGEAGEGDDALLRVFKSFHARYAISKNVLSQFQMAKSASALCVGDFSTVCALNPDRVDSVVCVEMTQARLDAATAMVGEEIGSKTEFVDSLVNVARRRSSIEGFDAITCCWHLSELPDEKGRDAALAVLWGCLKPGGHMVLIEDNAHEPLIQAVRSRLTNPASHSDSRNTASIVAPCTTDGKCPLASGVKKGKCTFPILYASPVTGPAPRSFNQKFAGKPLRRKHEDSSYSYLVLHKGILPKRDNAARILRTPTKRGGHVIFDLCMPDSTRQKLTVTRASLPDRNGLTYQQARQATAGSRLEFEVLDHVNPTTEGWHRTLDVRKQERSRDEHKQIRQSMREKNRRDDDEHDFQQSEDDEGEEDEIEDDESEDDESEDDEGDEYERDEYERDDSEGGQLSDEYDSDSGATENAEHDDSLVPPSSDDKSRTEK